MVENKTTWNDEYKFNASSPAKSRTNRYPPLFHHRNWWREWSKLFKGRSTPAIYTCTKFQVVTFVGIAPPRHVAGDSCSGSDAYRNFLFKLLTKSSADWREDPGNTGRNLLSLSFLQSAKLANGFPLPSVRKKVFYYKRLYLTINYTTATSFNRYIWRERI